MERYYFDIKIMSARAQYEAHAAHFISFVHGLSKGAAELAPRVGLAFPEWQPGHKPHECSIGSHIRVIGDKLSVMQMHRHHKVGEMAESGLFLIGDVEKVPEDAVEVSFVRDRQYEKYSRLKRKYPDIKHKSLDVSLPCILLDSKSSGRRWYPVIVRMERAGGRVDGVFNSYGLCKDGTTVPMF